MAAKDVTLHLPAEILGAIFLELHRSTATFDDPVQDFEAAKDDPDAEPLLSVEITVSHVCSRWRSIASETKRLWCMVGMHMFRLPQEASRFVVEQEMVETYLTRSDPFTMTIEIYSTSASGGLESPTRGARFLTRLSGHAHRFESLAIRVGIEELRYMAQHLFRTAHLQSLRLLAIAVRGGPGPEIPYHRRYVLGEETGHFNIAILHVRSLRSLRLHGLRPDILEMRHAKAPEYVTICHGAIIHQASLSKFLKEASATVVHLRLNPSFCGPFSRPASSSSMQMHALRKLEVSNINLLEHTGIPHITELHISGVHFGPSRFWRAFGLPGAPISTAFNGRVICKDMEKLTLDAASSYASDWIEIIAHFSGVRAYSIRHGEGAYWTGVPATLDIWVDSRVGLLCFPSLQHVVVRCQNQLLNSVAKMLLSAFGIRATAAVEAR